MLSAARAGRAAPVEMVGGEEGGRTGACDPVGRGVGACGASPGSAPRQLGVRAACTRDLEAVIVQDNCSIHTRELGCAREEAGVSCGEWWECAASRAPAARRILRRRVRGGDAAGAGPHSWTSLPVLCESRVACRDCAVPRGELLLGCATRRCTVRRPRSGRPRTPALPPAHGVRRERASAHEQRAGRGTVPASLRLLAPRAAGRRGAVRGHSKARRAASTNALAGTSARARARRFRRADRNASNAMGRLGR